MQKILEKICAEDDNKEVIELASEIKIAVISFQNLPKGTSPMAIIVARPQGNKEISSFASDMCEAARLFERDVKFVSFTNFAADSVSVETHDMLQTLCEFLERKKNHCAALDNEHNVKNDRYQLIGGSNAATMGNY